jgi:RNA polymerase sigma factor (sigma-70 family)
MSRSAVSQLLHHVRRLTGAQAAFGPDDRLLADFLARRDEAAFAALVGRHGPMVLNLCRRILRDTHAAEDAFQATFLVLADRAGAIRKRESLACWLHGVAYRLAVRAKRRRAESLASPEPAVAHDPAEKLARQEMLAVLDEELQRLPERYRAPLVLCYLDGRTQDEAAGVLGWSVGTLRRRLDQGRELLQARLRGRGVSLPAALGGLLAAGTAAVPGQVQAATVSAALAAMKQGGGVMFSASVKTLLALVASCGIVVGAGFWAFRTYGPRPEPAPEAVPAAEAADADLAVARAAEAVDACKEANWALLKELAVLEARRGNAAAARKRFAQAADRLATTSGYGRAAVLVMMAYGVASAGDTSAATALLEEARRLGQAGKEDNPRNEILRFAAVCCGEKVSTEKALAWAKEIPDENYRLNACRNIAVAQANAGDVAGALRTVELIRPPLEHARLEPWEAIVAAQLKAGDRAAAQETLAKALAVIERDRAKNRDSALGYEVTILLHYAVAQAGAGDRAAARETFLRVEKLLDPGARPETLTHLPSLAKAQVQAGETKAAAGTVARCFRIKERYGYDGVPATLVLAQILLGDIDGAVRFARGLTQPQERFDVFRALGEAGGEERAMAAAREAKTPEARAWALLGVASGVLNRVPPERRPRYAAGTFALVVPHKPGSPAPAKEDPAVTARFEMQQAIGEWEQAWREFNERLDKAKTPAERQKMLENDRPKGDKVASNLLALAGKHRGQPVAFEALAWIVDRSSLTPSGPEALSLLLRDHLASKDIGEVCSVASLTLRNDPNTEKLIRATLPNGPHHAAKGQACLALARLLHDRAREARFVQRRPAAKDEPPGLKRLRAVDPVKLEAEAEKFYERVLAEFADSLPFAPQRAARQVRPRRPRRDPPARRRQDGAGDRRQGPRRQAHEAVRPPRQGRRAGLLGEVVRAMPADDPAREGAGEAPGGQALRPAGRQRRRRPGRPAEVAGEGAAAVALVVGRRQGRRRRARHEGVERDGLADGLHPRRPRRDPVQGRA